MDWDVESIKLYVDDILVNEVALSETVNEDTKYGIKNPFHHSQYIIVNLALGGDHYKDMSKAVLPNEYIIDYIRVYQHKTIKE